MIVWSALSLIALLGGIGIMFAVYGRWSQKIGWHGDEASTLSFREPGEVSLTPAQRATIWFFAIVSVLFLAQTLVGAAAEHYRADLSNFFGLDLARLLPYNLARTWHVQLALFWTAAAFLAGGIFLVPFIARREPRRQSWLAYGLLGAVALVVFGSLITEALSIYGVIPAGGLFSQQWEYLDLPRLWQILLIIGMFLWIAIIWRGMRGRLRRRIETEYAVAVLLRRAGHSGVLRGRPVGRSDTHYTVADFWRFWVVHLWVEDFLELFTTVMVAYIFVLLGVVRERIALGVIFLDIILYSAGGVIGTMHHLYFSGTPVEHMALGAFFSAAEVIPLTFLTVEAWAFLQLGSRQQSGDANAVPASLGGDVPGRRRILELLGRGHLRVPDQPADRVLLPDRHRLDSQPRARGDDGRLWDAGRRPGDVRVPLRDPADKWPEKWARISFWCMNIGLAWMVFVTLLPLGVLQLYHSVNDGYFEARSLGYITRPGNSVLEWLRLPGDVILIVGVFCRSSGSPGPRCAISARVRPSTSCRNTRCTRVRPEPADRFRGVSEGLTDGPPDNLGVAGCRVRAGTCWPSAGASTRWPGGLRRRPPAGAQANSLPADHDAWVCPQDHWLWPTSFDPKHRVMRYRALPVVCNSCPVKSTCTTSDHGREISREIDPWPHSDAGRFHRGIACCVAGLGWCCRWRPWSPVIRLRTCWF